MYACMYLCMCVMSGNVYFCMYVIDMQCTVAMQVLYVQYNTTHYNEIFYNIQYNFPYNIVQYNIT